MERLEASLLDLEKVRRWRGRPGPERDLLESRLAGLEKATEAFRARAGAQLAALLRLELQGCLALYEEEKRAVGQLDFLDLLLRTRALLASNARVRAELQARFTHILVDEFQDTDPLQLEILLLLCSGDPTAVDPERVRPARGKLFVVGDPKQSIYRFRRADIESYERVKTRLVEEGDAALLQLTTSFRAVPEIQEAINAVFSRTMHRDAEAGQASYVPLAAAREQIPGQPALVALPLPDPQAGPWGASVLQVRRVEPEILAGFVEWLVRRSGWRVSDRRDPRTSRPLEARDVCLLFRSFRSLQTDLTRPYARALEARGLQAVVVGGRSFFSREEVDALVNALHVIEWPDDELSVYAALRGPLFGFDDEELLLFRRAGGRFSARSPGDPQRGQEVKGALEILGRLHPGRNRRAAAETLTRLLEETRCPAAFALRPDGDRAVRSLQRLQEIARACGRSPALSFRAFVLHLEALARSELSDVEPTLLEERSEGVLLMTVHKAKGLEFPVVVLADSAHGAPTSAGSLTDRTLGLFAAPLCGCVPVELAERRADELLREKAEALRLLYVATTRARDLLVVPVGEAPTDRARWLDPLLPAFQSSLFLDEDAPGCPLFRSGAAAPWRSTRPGLQKPRLGDHRFVLWDPVELPVKPKETLPLRHHDLLAERGRHQGSQERHRAFLEARARRLERAAVPRCSVLAATVLSHRPELFPEPLLEATRAVIVDRVPSPTLASSSSGPEGLRFGSLSHAILERALLGPGEAEPRLEEIGSQQGLVLGATEAEIAAAIERVRRALRHPLLVEAAAASRRLREVPVLLRIDLPGSTPLLAEGVIDLLFMEGDTIVVVDYKTDPNPDEERLEAYRRQVALYVEAVASALAGRTVRGHLLFL